MPVKGSFKVSLLDADPELAKEFDVRKNGITPDRISSSERNINRHWVCSECSYNWEATVDNRCRPNIRSGCPLCANRVCIPGVNSLSVTNKKLASEWHPTLNGDLTPDLVVSGTNKDVWWLCRDCSHEWNVSINTRNSQGTGCPNCNGFRQKSFPEMVIYYYLKSLIPSTLSKYKIEGNSEIDVFIPDLNLAIEYDGFNWHKDRYNEDKHKNYLLSNLKFIRIREEGLEPIEDFNCKNIFVRGGSRADLERVIVKLLNFIKNLSGLQNKDVDVNIERDNNAIRELLSSKVIDNSVASQYPNLVVEWDFKKNGSLNPNNTPFSFNGKVWWLCKDWKHSFLATPNDRTAKGRPTSCPYCKNQKVMSGFNDLLTTEPLIAREWLSSTKFSSPTEVVFGSATPVTWECSDCSSTFTCPIDARTSVKARDCPKCTRKFALVGKLTLNGDIVAVRFMYGKRFCDVELDLLSECGFSFNLSSVQELPLQLVNDKYITEIELKYHLHIKEIEYSDDNFFTRLNMYLRSAYGNLPILTINNILQLK